MTDPDSGHIFPDMKPKPKPLEPRRTHIDLDREHYEMLLAQMKARGIATRATYLRMLIIDGLRAAKAKGA